jgi:hypothetical protein
LGGHDSKIVDALNVVTGGLVLATAPLVLPLLCWLDAKDEFIRLSRELVHSVAEKRSGLSRYSRTQRLEAANVVLMVTAYFEVLAEQDLPFKVKDLKLDKQHQVALVGGGEGGQKNLIDVAIAAVGLHVAPHQPADVHRDLLHRFYVQLNSELRALVATVADLDPILDPLPERALVRYQERFTQLAAELPEVGWWANWQEHAATRTQVRRALAGIEERLTAVTIGRDPDERRQALARANQAALTRPIVEAGETPAGAAIPTIAEAYIEPRFRVSPVPGDARLADDDWWSEIPVRDGLDEFLTAYLTSPDGAHAPLLVLGHPGAGKSLLTRVLAGRLPAADFLAVRVALRDVPAAAPVQEQIEQAMTDATGERLAWPDLARSAGDALPVVLLDGFDELIQATGVSHTDYLQRVATFQEREYDQGRPVAIIITSRTTVANQARPPHDCAALRLEPFDDPRIRAWIETWNRANAGFFRTEGLAALSVTQVLARRDLAEQPLLLLMLALYDLDGNALGRLAPDLPQHVLYERLLRRFAEREVEKHHRGLSPAERDRLVGEELRTLALVGFAMFNRGAQWVTEVELRRDLAAITGAGTRSTGSDLRSPVSPAEVVLGRFFFVHKAQATQDTQRLETYEFLHATFGEYLIAWLTWQVLDDLARRQAASTLSFQADVVADDLLYALLSFAPLSARRPILDSLAAMMALAPESDRLGYAKLAVRLFQTGSDGTAMRRFGDYTPRRLGVIAREATYRANLVLLAVVAAGTLHGHVLFGHSNPVDEWHSETLLWQSQLGPTQFQSMVEALSVQRIWDEDERDVKLCIGDITIRPPRIELRWTYDLPGQEPGAYHTYFNQDLAKLAWRANFQCDEDRDVLQHGLELLEGALPQSLNTFGQPEAAAETTSALHRLVRLWLLALRDDAPPEDRNAAYLSCVEILKLGLPPWTEAEKEAYAMMILSCLAADPRAPIVVAEAVVWAIVEKVESEELHARVARYVSGLTNPSDGLLGLAARSTAKVW